MVSALVILVPPRMAPGWGGLLNSSFSIFCLGEEEGVNAGWQLHETEADGGGVC